MTPEDPPRGDSRDPVHAASGSDARARMLDRVRRAQPAPKPCPTVPLFPIDDTRSPRERFETALTAMGGTIASIGSIGTADVVDAADAVDAAGSEAATLSHWLAARFGSEARIASAVEETAGNMPLHADLSPSGFDALDVGVVRARFGVCETGSVWLSETEYIVNAIGYLAQHLVVLLDPAALVPGLQDAYRRDDFKTARYCVLVTGPSATADIEGVMIRGAQGVRSLTVIWSPTPEVV